MSLKESPFTEADHRMAGKILEWLANEKTRELRALPDEDQVKRAELKAAISHLDYSATIILYCCSPKNGLNETR